MSNMVGIPGVTSFPGNPILCALSLWGLSGAEMEDARVFWGGTPGSTCLGGETMDARRAFCPGAETCPGGDTGEDTDFQGVIRKPWPGFFQGFPGRSWGGNTLEPCTYDLEGVISLYTCLLEVFGTSSDKALLLDLRYSLKVLGLDVSSMEEEFSVYPLCRALCKPLGKSPKEVLLPEFSNDTSSKDVLLSEFSLGKSCKEVLLPESSLGRSSSEVLLSEVSIIFLVGDLLNLLGRSSEEVALPDLSLR